MKCCVVLTGLFGVISRSSIKSIECPAVMLTGPVVAVKTTSELGVCWVTFMTPRQQTLLYDSLHLVLV